jgi:hypothetical protein
MRLKPYHLCETLASSLSLHSRSEFDVFPIPLILFKNIATALSVIFRNDVNCLCRNTLAVSIFKASN